VACVGDGFNPDGGPCLRCQGTGADPDPCAVTVAQRAAAHTVADQLAVLMALCVLEPGTVLPVLDQLDGLTAGDGVS
jgi:hypothetical protein